MTPAPPRPADFLAMYLAQLIKKEKRKREEKKKKRKKKEKTVSYTHLTLPTKRIV